MPSLRSILSAAPKTPQGMGHQAALASGVVPGAQPGAQPALGATQPPMAAPNVGAAPPMEAGTMPPAQMPQGPAGLDAMSPEQLISLIRNISPEDFLMMLDTVPPELQQQVLAAANMINPAIGEFLQRSAAGQAAVPEQMSPAPAAPVAPPMPGGGSLREQLVG